MVERIRRELLAAMPLTVVVPAALGAGLIHLLVGLINFVAPLAVSLIWISC